MDPTDNVLAALQSRDCKPRKSGDSWQARCPAHDDKQASLSISEGQDGKVLLHCHAGCKLDEMAAALNMEKRHLFPPRDPAPKVNGANQHQVKQSPPPLSDAQVKTMAEELRKDAAAW